MDIIIKLELTQIKEQGIKDVQDVLLSSLPNIFSLQFNSSVLTDNVMTIFDIAPPETAQSKIDQINQNQELLKLITGNTNLQIKIIDKKEIIILEGNELYTSTFNALEFSGRPSPKGVEMRGQKLIDEFGKSINTKTSEHFYEFLTKKQPPNEINYQENTFVKYGKEVFLGELARNTFFKDNDAVKQYMSNKADETMEDFIQQSLLKYQMPLNDKFEEEWAEKWAEELKQSENLSNLLIEKLTQLSKSKTKELKNSIYGILENSSQNQNEQSLENCSIIKYKQQNADALTNSSSKQSITKTLSNKIAINLIERILPRAVILYYLKMS